MRSALLLLFLAPQARADRAAEALQLLDQGIAHFQAGRLDAARDSFIQARDLVPDKPNPHRWLGLVYARQGRCAEAVTEVDVFIQRVPASDPRAVEAVTLRDRCQPEAQKPRLDLAPEEPITERPPAKKKPRYWVYGVTGGAVVVVAVALGVGLGIGLTNSSSGLTTLPTIGR